MRRESRKGVVCHLQVHISSFRCKLSPLWGFGLGFCWEYVRLPTSCSRSLGRYIGIEWYILCYYVQGHIECSSLNVRFLQVTTWDAFKECVNSRKVHLGAHDTLIRVSIGNFLSAKSLQCYWYDRWSSKTSISLNLKSITVFWSVVSQSHWKHKRRFCFKHIPQVIL